MLLCNIQLSVVFYSQMHFNYSVALTVPLWFSQPVRPGIIYHVDLSQVVANLCELWMVGMVYFLEKWLPQNNHLP